MLKIVHIQANKMASKTRTIDFYDITINGVQKYHTVVLNNIIIHNKKLLHLLEWD